jgi:hypothetical protein
MINGFNAYRNMGVGRRYMTEAQENEHHLNWSITIVSSAQEAVIRTNEIMRDSWCVWRSEELG